MGKVRMRNLRDNLIYEFDGKNAQKALDSGDWQQELDTGQMLAKGIGGMLPTIGGGVGGAAGFLGAGGASAGFGAIPGAVGGAALGGAAGQGVNEAMQGIAGVVRPSSPLDVAGRIAEQGAQQGAYETLGGPINIALSRATASTARPLMRYALQPKRLGPADQFIEDIALKHKIPVTQESIPFLRKLSRTVGPVQIQRIIAKETADPKGMRFSWNELRSVMAEMAKNAESSDVVSMASQRAMKQAQAVLKYKLEGKTLTPFELQNIKKFSQEEAKKLYEARAALKDPQIGPMEGAYKAIADQSQRMLERIPDVAKTNRQIAEAIALQKEIWAATLRKPPTLVPGMIGAGAAGTAHAFNPAAVARGAAGFFGSQAAISPAATSRLALAANNPAVQRNIGIAAGQLPRLGGGAFEAISGKTPLAAILASLQNKEPLGEAQ